MEKKEIRAQLTKNEEKNLKANKKSEYLSVIILFTLSTNKYLFKKKKKDPFAQFLQNTPDCKQ